MSRKLLVFAEFEEAKETISKLHAKPVNNTSSLYTFEKGLIALCGVGTHGALATTLCYLDEVDEVINLGLCGALKEGLELGILNTIGTVSKFTPCPNDLDPTSLAFLQRATPSFSLQKSGLKLLSSDFPIHDVSLKRALQKMYDVVDMEGYGVAFAANQKKKKCTLIKIVSDFASPEGRKLIVQHKKQLSTQLAQELFEIQPS